MLNPVSIQRQRKTPTIHTHEALNLKTVRKAPHELDLNIHIFERPDYLAQTSTSTIHTTRGIGDGDEDTEAPSPRYHDMSQHPDSTLLPPPDSKLSNSDLLSYVPQYATPPDVSYAESGHRITPSKHLIPPGLPGLSSLPEHEAQYLLGHYAMQHSSNINDGREAPQAGHKDLHKSSFQWPSHGNFPSHFQVPHEEDEGQRDLGLY